MAKKKRARKRMTVPGLILRIALGVLIALTVCIIALIGYLTVTEYRPNATEPAEILVDTDLQDGIQQGVLYTAMTMNIGYAGNGEESDFFLDGGHLVRTDESLVYKNLNGIREIVSDTAWDFLLLQEVDRDSKRSYGIDEALVLAEDLGKDAQFVTNYRCAYVPYPLPTIGRVHSGLFSAALAEPLEAKRVSLPVSFGWPVRMANLKRALLLQRFSVEGTDRQLVMINVHLEAYDDGEGRKAQTAFLLDTMRSEYEKGNYVIAGGDFCQCTPEVLERYPVTRKEYWTPGVFAESLPVGWGLLYDPETPSCRLLNVPLNDPDFEQFYVIDGFICSPNVAVEFVHTLDCGFLYADHNPVLMQFMLLP